MTENKKFDLSESLIKPAGTAETLEVAALDRDEFEQCECRSEWVTKGFLRGVSLCKYCQNILRETGMTEGELEAEAKSLNLALD
jgi:hypothetical protein